MRLTETELSELVRSQAARRPTAAQECLSEGLLLRAAAKELDRPERERVASHLAVCRDCVRDYRIARSVRGWTQESAISNGLQAKHTTQRQDAAEVRFLARAGAKARSGWPVYRRVFPYAVAASLITVVVLVGWLASVHRNDLLNLERLNAQLADRDRAIHELQQSIDEARRSPGTEDRAEPGRTGTDVGKTGIADESNVARLRGMVAELSRPQFNVPIVDVEPGQARGGPGGATTAIEVPKSANQFTLILHTSGKGPDAGYSLEILGAGGKLIFRGNVMKNTSDSGLTVALSRPMMPSGKYTVRLYDMKRNRTEPIEQYVVEVHYR